MPPISKKLLSCYAKRENESTLMFRKGKNIMIANRLITGWEHFKGSLGGIFEVWRADKLNNHFNVPWHAVELPHCFNAYDTVDPDVTYYEGQGWYRTKLKLANPYPQGRTLLHFEGAGQKSKVYVYTEEVASHVGGYDEFTVDITGAAVRAAAIERYAAQNVTPVAVLCDNTRDLEMIPSDASDFNLYGGLYRYVNLVYVPAVSLERVHISVDTADGAKAIVRVKARLYNPEGHADAVNLHVAVTDPNGAAVAEIKLSGLAPWQGEKTIAEFEINEPALWSPETPLLYGCQVTLASKHGETGRSERFGVRFFEFAKKGPFYLNGKRLLLRGTHRHDDHAGVGAAMTEEMIRTELMLMKEMGVNFVRLGHYQQSQIVLNLCDELGFIVWEEIPWCRGGIGGESYRQQCRSMLKAMIDQHYNHPSIILWGLGNENDWECDFDYFDQEEIRAFMRELHELSHSLDPSRLTSIRRCEFCKDIVDVYSPSIWAGWYRGIYPEYEQYMREGFEGTDRFLHVEWGADNVAGRHLEKPYTGFTEIATGQGADERDGDYFLTGGEPRVSSLGDWSETYFCDLIDWYLKCQEKMDWLTGTAQWVFKDFSTPVRPENPVPYVNQKGVLERDFTKKESYYVFQSYWTKKPMVRLYAHSMPVRWGKPGESKLVKVYSNCERAELFLNGVSLGVKVRNSQDFPCAGLRWNAVFREGANRLHVKAYQGSTVVEDAIEFEYQTQPWGAPARLELKTVEVEPGLIRLEAKAYDANGVFCPDAANFVRFAVAGEGRLIDNLGTVRGSRYVQLTNGRASIMVEVYGNTLAASVISDGLQGAAALIK